MPKRKTKQKKQKTPTQVRDLAGALFSAGDDYVLACAEVITRAKDGSSRRVLDMMQKALNYQQKVRVLFSILDPEHYRMEAHK